MADRQVSDGRGNGLEKGNTWLWFGGRGCSVRHIGRTYLVVNKGRKKHIVRKKRFIRQKIQQKKKKQKVISMVLTEIDPAPLWRQI